MLLHDLQTAPGRGSVDIGHHYIKNHPKKHLNPRVMACRKEWFMMICIHNEWFIWLIWMTTTTSVSCAYETIPFFTLLSGSRRELEGGWKKMFWDVQTNILVWDTVHVFFSEAMTTLLQQFPETWLFSYTKIRPNSYFWTKYCSLEPTFLTLSFRLKDLVCPCEDTKRSCKRFWFLHSGFYFNQASL